MEMLLATLHESEAASSRCVTLATAARSLEVQLHFGCSVGRSTTLPNSDLRYSARNASSGEIRLARKAGMRDASIADNPSARTAPTVTTGLYGFIP